MKKLLLTIVTVFMFFDIFGIKTFADTDQELENKIQAIVLDNGDLIIDIPNEFKNNNNYTFQGVGTYSLERDGETYDYDMWFSVPSNENNQNQNNSSDNFDYLDFVSESDYTGTSNVGKYTGDLRLKSANQIGYRYHISDNNEISLVNGDKLHLYIVWAYKIGDEFMYEELDIGTVTLSGANKVLSWDNFVISVDDNYENLTLRATTTIGNDVIRLLENPYNDTKATSRYYISVNQYNYDESGNKLTKITDEIRVHNYPGDSQHDIHVTESAVNLTDDANTKAKQIVLPISYIRGLRTGIVEISLMAFGYQQTTENKIRVAASDTIANLSLGITTDGKLQIFGLEDINKDNLQLPQYEIRLSCTSPSLVEKYKNNSDYNSSVSITLHGSAFDVTYNSEVVESVTNYKVKTVIQNDNYMPSMPNGTYTYKIIKFSGNNSNQVGSGTLTVNKSSSDEFPVFTIADDSLKLTITSDDSKFSKTAVNPPASGKDVVNDSFVRNLNINSIGSNEVRIQLRNDENNFNSIKSNNDKTITLNYSDYFSGKANGDYSFWVEVENNNYGAPVRCILNS